MRSESPQQQLSLLDPGSSSSRSGAGKSSLQSAQSESNTRVCRSALWAAYGDALGWISELTTEDGLKRRTHGTKLSMPIQWTRRIGGISGLNVALPAGCYSDDSQLRLATCRAIGPDGFDVQAFAKVELPVWLSYALGGGRATTKAARNLANPKTVWYSNSFKDWTQSGGNGAAMRIQPHVWAAQSLSKVESFLPDVVRNTVCTHSHPLGVLGAVLHALTLSHTLNHRQVPSPSEALALVELANQLPEIIADDIEINTYWRSSVERESRPFLSSWNHAIQKCRQAITIASEIATKSAEVDRYRRIVDQLHLRRPENRGNGTLTAVAATALTWCETRPAEALCIAANEIGTDTDTISTMAGAILGIVSHSDPPIDVLDADLIRAEARRLAGISCGARPAGHRYPDLMYWSAPESLADALVTTDAYQLFVRGIGPVVPVEAPMRSAREKFMWQWVRSQAGQTLLVKRRTTLSRYDAEAEIRSVEAPTGNVSGVDSDPMSEVPETGTVRSNRSSVGATEALDLDLALKYIRSHAHNDAILTRSFRRVLKKGTEEQVKAFTEAFISLLRESSLGAGQPLSSVRQAGHEVGGHLGRGKPQE